MNKYITPEVNEFNFSSPEYNVIKAEVNYKKGDGVYLYLQEGKLEKSETYDSFSFDMFGSKRKAIHVADMKRLNRKKLEAIQEEHLKNETLLINLLK